MSMPPQDAAAGRIKLGWEDLLDLPDDGNRYELLDGDLIMTPPPSVRHQLVLGHLNRMLDAHVRTEGLGTVLFAPLAVRLDETTIAEPDLIYVASDRVRIIGDQAINGAPNLLVEVLSPSTAKRDRTVKAQLYARLGVEHYWLIDPDAERVETFELADDSYRSVAVLDGASALDPPLFPGLRIDLSSLWR
jgi:Uma2 family endonuclease